MKASAVIFSFFLAMAFAMPASAFSYAPNTYGYSNSYYYEPYAMYQPYNHPYYQPIYYGYYDMSYYYQPQYTYQPVYYQPQTYNYGNQYGYSTPSPYNYSYPTGDTDTFGSDICYWEGHGRGLCSFNPRQPVYDHWTGTWY